MTTTAGTGIAGSTPFQLNNPCGIALDPLTGFLYITEYSAGTIRALDPASPPPRVMPTVASGLSCPFDIAIDSYGNGFVSDPCAYAIFHLDTSFCLKRIMI